MLRPLLLGACFFLAMPSLAFYEKSVFNQKESYYNCPIISESNAVTMRSDAYGKGFFGASRNGKRKHMGIDFTLPIGSAVIASKSGRVFFAGEDKGYGFYIELRHPDGLLSRYAHLSEIRVKEGDWVPQGQEIGLSGKSGNAVNPRMTPHLHFEIRYGRHPLDPQVGLLDPKIQIRT